MSIDVKKSKIIDSFLVVVFVAIIAGTCGLFVNKGMSWYMALVKPKIYISDYVFAAVWTIIYGIEIVALIYLIVKGCLNKYSITMIIANGIMNVLWCLMFFVFNNPLLGLIVIIINLMLSFILWINLGKCSKWIEIAFVVYPLWMSLATALNMSIWILN